MHETEPAVMERRPLVLKQWEPEELSAELKRRAEAVKRQIAALEDAKKVTQTLLRECVVDI